MFFLTQGLCCPLVKDGIESKGKVFEGLVLSGQENGIEF